MRLWSLHPRHFDRIGLVACWRESLLAQAVLAGLTAGYRQHPQLERFRSSTAPLESVGAYLAGLAEEAEARGYRFNAGKIMRRPERVQLLAVTEGQLAYEWAHLGAKLDARSETDAERWRQDIASPHPLFTVISGPVEEWERV